MYIMERENWTKQRKWQENHEEENKRMKRDWYLRNKDKQNERVTCAVCNITVPRKNVSVHTKTKKHQYKVEIARMRELLFEV
jgi:hypothetical protein